MAATARIMIGKFCQTFDLNSSRDSFAACRSLEVGAASVSMIHLFAEAQRAKSSRRIVLSQRVSIDEVDHAANKISC